MIILGINLNGSLSGFPDQGVRSITGGVTRVWIAAGAF
jgi:hypothetical protein